MIENNRAATQGRLLVRPTQPTQEISTTGFHSLGLDDKRDGLLYVPTNYRADRPAPLVLALHGAGGQARSGLAPLLSFADQFGVLLLAPDSRERTWDVLLGGYGPDVTFINAALAETFNHCAIDPSHLAIEGFSDGASYALSLGLTNGDLFTHVIAFSPGFMAAARLQGLPHIYISHGLHDQVLPIKRCSQRIVPDLQRVGYDVLYHEFDGPHTVPMSIAREALNWFLQPKEQSTPLIR